MGSQMGKYVSITDRTLAYEFKYPSVTSNKLTLELVYSRRPEKYSSAAPLTTNARQRIVCEFLDISFPLTVSVFVTPLSVNYDFKKVSQWTNIVDETIAKTLPVKNQSETII